MKRKIYYSNSYSFKSIDFEKPLPFVKMNIFLELN